MPLPSYQIVLKDTDGIQKALMTGAKAPSTNIPAAIFTSLGLTHAENKPGTLRIHMNGQSETADTFTPGTQVEVWRTIPTLGIPSYKEWEGFFFDPKLELDASGEYDFTANCRSYLQLAQMRYVKYSAGSSFITSSGPGETVIKEIVNENLGPGASNAAREISGVAPGLVIEVDMARGTAWSGSYSWKKMLDIITKVANETGVVFDIVGTGPATFEFRVYSPSRGVDRSEGNSVYPAIIFSDTFRNLISAVYVKKTIQARNSVTVLGSGRNSARLRSTATNTTAIAKHPWALSEDVINTNNETIQADLDLTAAAELIARQELEEFSFVPLLNQTQVYANIESTISGIRRFWWGDIITGRLGNVQHDKRIAEVSLSVSNTGEENFTFKMVDVLEY